MKNNTYIFIIFICFLCAQPRKYYTYSLNPSNSICKKLYNRLNLKSFQEYNELDYLEITVKGDQGFIKNGDIFNFVFKNKHKKFEKQNLSFAVDQTENKSRWKPIINQYKPSQFGESVEKNIIIDEKDILMSPGITLNLTYNNQSSQTQIYGKQNESLSKDLKNYEKEFMGLPKYIRSQINMTKDYYSKDGDEESGLDKINLVDIDRKGEKVPLRTNEIISRYFYVSDSSLFSQGVDVFDHRLNMTAKYKVWQSKKENPIPIELEKHGIRPGDMKDFKITNYDMAPTPNIKELKYREDPKYRELSDNIYEYRKKQKLVKAYYFKPRLLSNLPSRKPAWVLVDNKISTKFVYLLEEEYEFKENDENEVVFAPLDDGGKTTVKTLGDIQRHWVPVITSFIVILGLL